MVKYASLALDPLLSPKAFLYKKEKFPDVCAVSCAGGMSLHLCLATLLNCFSNCDCYEYCSESKTYHAACGNADDIFSEEEE